ncbi:MAG: PadR family transcriptional regulator [Veillonellales bacterium]
MEKGKQCPCKGINLDKLIQPAALAILAVEDLHGYNIVQKLRANELHGKNLDSSGVYRCLKMMEQRGLITAAWDISVENGPARRLYSITVTGRDCLHNWLDSLNNYYFLLGLFLNSVKSIVKNRIVDKGDKNVWSETN